MASVYLLLGSNLGDRFFYMETAAKRLEQTVGMVSGMSAYYETAPWGFTAEQQFLNCLVRIETGLSPRQVLAAAQSIEQELGRQRTGHNEYSSRTMDIDILFFENYIVAEPDLMIPHPHLHKRRFALLPLAEIAPSLVHPVLNRTAAQMLNTCTDTLRVVQLQKVAV